MRVFVYSVVAEILPPGGNNPYYSLPKYVGSRVLEFNQSRRYSNYTELYWAQNIVADDFSNIYLADGLRHVVVWIHNVTGEARILAGEKRVPGHRDGSLVISRLSSPHGLALLRKPKAVHIFVADKNNHCIRKILYNERLNYGRVETIAGVPGDGGLLDGPAKEAKFEYPLSLGIDTKDESLYVLDGTRLRRIDGRTGLVQTLVNGACRGIGQYRVLSTILVHRVGCHPDWLRRDTPEGVEEVKFYYFCRGHAATCGPRHHPILRDELSCCLQPAPKEAGYDEYVAPFKRPGGD